MNRSNSEKLWRDLGRGGLAVGVWLAFIVGFFCHVYLRGRADDLGPAAVSPAVVESFLFHGIPSIWLQSWFSTDTAIITWATVILHASWFYVPLLLAIVLHIRCGTQAVAKLFGLLLALFFSADLLFAIVPTQPPWMEYNLVRVVHVAYGDSASADKNPIAALPSLHVALPVLLTIWCARRSDSLLRRLAPLLAVWTVAVAWASIYGGEHYVVDALAGAGWAAVVYSGSLAATMAMNRISRGSRSPTKIAAGQQWPAPIELDREELRAA